MKYIVFEVPDLPPTPVIFPDHIAHSDISMTMRKEKAWLPVSAGFMGHIDAMGYFWASGESISLKLKSNPNDATLIQRFFDL